MKFNVQVDVAAAVRAIDDRFRNQVPFAVAKALTDTARKVKDGLPAELDRVLDKPTPFTKRGIFVRPARKNDLRAVVGFQPAQANYLQWQVYGGERAPNRKALRLPSAIGLDAFGNLPKGTIAQLLRVAVKQGRLSRKRSSMLKVSRKVEVFYGDPADVGAHHFPPGIYERIPGDNGSGRLIPLVVFPQRNARYKPRLNLQEFARSVIASEFRPALDQALTFAIATAR